MNYISLLIERFLNITLTPKASIEIYQRRIRDFEWKKIEQYIPKESDFLDVGCGAGYSLMKAIRELNCNAKGIDPAPGEHGVGRYTSNIWESLPIVKGEAENIPFPDKSFDVVYSSHVIEHVYSEVKALAEMKRVLKDDGILIIGMPTATMAIIATFSSFLFTTHISLYHFLKSIGKVTMLNRFLSIFLPRSHSYPRASYITYDLFHYRIKNWQKLVDSEFKIEKVITPALYPYPDFLQWFPWIKNCRYSSSVFFICKKV
jgi:ubiquinone/menaquinone biosynthesis C-methylase UbiE